MGGAMREILPHIRFNTMSPDFFVDKVVPSGVLNKKEIVELLSARTTGRPAPRFPEANLPRYRRHAVAVDSETDGRLSEGEEPRLRPGDSPGGGSPVTTPRIADPPAVLASAGAPIRGSL